MGGLVVGMIAFALALVPLYKGLSGEAAAKAPAVAGKPGQRAVTVHWVGVSGSEVPVRITALDPAVSTVLGVRRQVTFRFTNLSAKTVSFQAVHSIEPPAAQEHVTKTVCFCFTKQTLKPHQTRDLPVVYFVDKGLPAGIADVYVGYTLFPIDSPARS